LLVALPPLVGLREEVVHHKGVSLRGRGCEDKDGGAGQEEHAGVDWDQARASDYYHYVS
jgi:hypothetical protein